ncbi:aryl hydrocarbon receptor-like [Mya arenaria]|uniref:aryl hydrocarbon receptor-like n=1 Tax=Mya arenaria TaxID=6604 RepID=UPI0022DFCC82|nr:aryl hydrocarbon receptor-like [Mya arenaria]
MIAVLDGFVLAATVDGLVMFVTTNVTDFTGYHQTDLLHRCMYGIVHPDDRASLKHQLEDTRTYKQYNNSSNETGSEDQKVAFLCRMKCYHGNSTGHVKFHCSGKILRSTHLPKTVKSSNCVLLLLCRPFVPSVGVAGYEDGDLIMWSKHDLGLQFEDCEQRLHTCLGYSMDEMTSRSLYQLVHPEDIHLLAHAHSLMMIGGGVQQVFLRLVRADGGCVWATTKGKAVSRNSKKFSVVFTHSPMGEDVGDFINQEEVRRRDELVNRTITTQHTQGNPEQYHAAQESFGNAHEAMSNIGGTKYPGNGRTPGIRYHVVCSDSERVRNSLQDTDMHEHGGHYKRIKHEADNSRDAEMYGMCSSVRKHQCSTTFNPPRSRSYDIEASIHMRVVENEHSDVANVFIPDFDNFGMQFS